MTSGDSGGVKRIVLNVLLAEEERGFEMGLGSTRARCPIVRRENQDAPAAYKLSSGRKHLARESSVNGTQISGIQSLVADV
jgi:hypothetical protein